MLLDCYTEVSDEKMEKELLQSLQLDQKKYVIEVQNSLMIDNTESGNYAMTSLSRFMSDVGSEKLDVCGMLQNSYLKYDHSRTFLDLRECFTEEQLSEIEDLSKEIPIFRSSNMSLEINLMASLVQKVAEVLSESDIEIIETHHNKKIDSPSGTAILLADAINKVFDNEKEYNFDRMSKREKRDKKEIGFSAIRGGNIVGEHTVQFYGENETLEITHKSYSRQVFAEGALKASRFIVNAKIGLYDMKDLV